MLTADQKTELTDLIETTLQGCIDREDLLRMLDATEPVILDRAMTTIYQESPAADVVERMIDIGLVIAETTEQWWPSANAKLREIIQAWPTRLECMGHTIWMAHNRTGNRCCASIAEPTVAAVKEAIKRAKAELKARVSTTRRQKAAERSADAS